MSGVPTESPDMGGRHRSVLVLEQSPRQDSSEERKERKARRPDLQIYRPPRGRPGGGDGLSPTVRQETAEKLNEEENPNRPSEQLEKSKSMGMKKSKSDVGREEGGFDMPCGGTPDRRDSGGRLIRGEQNQNSRRGRGGRNWRQQESYDQSSAGNLYQQQSTSRAGFRNQQPREGGKGRNKPGIVKYGNGTVAFAVSDVSRFAKKEFSRTETEDPDLGEKQWRRYVVKETSATGASTSAPVPAADYSSKGPEQPCATSTPQEQPGSPNAIESTLKSLNTVAAMDGDHGTNLSWGDEMEAEDRRQMEAAIGAGGAGRFGVSTNGSAAMNIGPADRRPFTGKRGGLIQMPPGVANAYNRSEQRGKRGAGRGMRGNSGWDMRQHNPHTVGRGIRQSTQGLVFPEPHQFGSQSIRLRGPGPPREQQFQPISNMRHCRPMQFPPPPPAYADHGEANNDRHLPADLAREINHLENEVMQLAKVCSSGHLRKTEMKQMLSARKKLQQLFEDAVMINPLSEEQKNLDHCMWKAAFYQPVEALRSVLHANAHGSGHDYCMEELLALIDEGIKFYEGLLKSHETNYGFKLEQHYHSIDDKLTKVLTPTPSDKSRSVKYSLACCQRYLVSMGDLARYREQVMKTQQYGIARNYYNKAAQLAPTNGRAHNQLALLAVYTNRYLDAVFYYVRSLAAKHPFTTAKESLSGLFEDIRKKADHYEAGRKKELDQLRKERAKDGHRSTKRLNQREIWKFPDGRMSKIEMEKQEIDEAALMTKISAQELHKRCIVYLLRSAGILFTKIGVECFEDTAQAGLIQLQALLALDESPLSSAQLVQLTVVLIFLIHYTGGGETESGVIKAVQNNAILLSFSVFGLLLERLRQFLENESVLESFNKNLHILLPSVRIFSMWMSIMENYKVYSDLASSVGGLETQRFSISLWNELSNVCNMLEDLKNDGKLKLVVTDSKDRKSVDALEAVLPEDLYITSFCGVFSRTLSSCKLSKEVDRDVAAEHCRLDWLVQLATFLDGCNCEWLSITNGKYVATARPDSPGAGKIRAAASDEEGADADIEPRNSIGEQDWVGEMSQLQLLQKEHEMKQTALERENQCRAEIIVEPHYLVVDTNTFIDHCGQIMRIVMSKQYKLAVPFVVYNELLGLEKNEEPWVSKQATASVKMLQDFTKGPLSEYSKYVEAYTSSGVCLDLEYHNNELSEQRTSNDDLILSCCRKLVSAKQGESVAKHEIKNLRYEPITIHRKIVLVTDDKNLRLKAKGDDIPVIGIGNFVKLARLMPR